MRLAATVLPGAKHASTSSSKLATSTLYRDF